MLYSSAAGSDLRHLRGLLPICVRLGPAWFRRMLLDLVPNEKVQRVKYVCDTLNAGCVALFKTKKAEMERADEELMQKVGEGKDVMSLLCKL